MKEDVINQEEIQEDLNQLASWWEQSVNEMAENVGVEATVRKFMEDNNLEYSFDKETRRFVIQVCHGCCIEGNWESPLYNLSFKINRDGVSLQTSYWDLYLPIIGFQAMLQPIIAQLLSQICKIGEKMDEMVNAHKKSVDIQPMIMQSFGGPDKKKLSLTPVETSPGVYFLAKEILPNVRLGIKLDASNYMERCEQFKKALKKLPICFNDKVWKDVTAYCYPLARQSESPMGVWPEKYVMSYAESKVPAARCNVPVGITSSEQQIYDALKSMQFAFQTSDDGTLEVFINNNIILKRKGKDSWFNIRGNGAKLKLSEAEFIKVLELLTVGSGTAECVMLEDSYPNLSLGEFISGFIPNINYLMPPEAKWNVSPAVFQIPGLPFLVFKNSTHKAVDILYSVLKHIPDLKTLADLINDEAIELEVRGYVNPNKFSQWEIWNG